MPLEILTGPTLTGRIIFSICLAIAAGVYGSVFLAILYHRFWFRRFIAPRLDNEFVPRIGLIVPCKGIPRNFKENIAAFLKLEYTAYKVIFVVESESDPALPVIREVIQGDERASAAVAGLSTHCAQKNFNLLKGIELSSDAEVYVFADSDIQPGPHWLQRLTGPLSSPSITVTSGYRWMYVKHGSLAEQNHMFFSNFLYILFSVASFIRNVGLWGGSMAIRKRDFDELGVAARWAETAVDDISLAEIIVANRRKSIIVPSCVIQTEDAIGSLGDSIRWIERQMMFLKMYHTPYWLTAIPVIFAVFLILAWLPLAALIGLLVPELTFTELGGRAALFFALLDTSSSLWYFMLGKTRSFGRFLILHPLLRFLQMFSLARTAFTNTIVWSGTAYRLHVRSGRVIGVQRGV